MSDRPCNYCNYKRYKADAKHDNMALTYLHNRVWIHPRDIKIPTNAHPDNPKYKPYFRAWFMELTDRCAC